MSDTSKLKSEEISSASALPLGCQYHSTSGLSAASVPGKLTHSSCPGQNSFSSSHTTAKSSSVTTVTVSESDDTGQ